MAIKSNGGRPAGLPKTGGRTKGTPNRCTVALKEKLDAIGCDPMIELARIGMNEKNPTALRVQCFSEIAQYVYPKRKPVDYSNDQPMVTTVITKLESGESPLVGDHTNSLP